MTATFILKMVFEAEMRQLRGDAGQMAICGSDRQAASEGGTGGGLCGHQVQGWNNKMNEPKFKRGGDERVYDPMKIY